MIAMQTIHTTEDISWAWHLEYIWCACFNFAWIYDTHTHTYTQHSSCPDLPTMPFPSYHCNRHSFHFWPFMHVISMLFSPADEDPCDPCFPVLDAHTHDHTLYTHPPTSMGTTTLIPFAWLNILFWPSPFASVWQGQIELASDSCSSYCYGKWSCTFTFTHSITLMDLLGYQAAILWLGRDVSFRIMQKKIEDRY